ncbi:cation:proton antiporter [Pseudochryseolinea flava]|uniref:Cation/H(+) antiporter n=1 Tax=Pseudochryseolinea flava TaxID=2059302 RepID=A0A364Y5M3_9BACT|nr:cation:proton antiporter [Pseudochryseolinea flava]RAW02169.1 cation/H(+) antiporter [Pseudochryseolinea flava]
MERSLSTNSSYKKAGFYIAVIGAFAFFIYFILQRGSALEEGRDIATSVTDTNYWTEFIVSLKHSFSHPLAILLGQIATIIIVARFFGYLAGKIRQPAVVGEVIAGIILGPSLLGLYFPEFTATLFPKQSLGNLQFLSQIGLILFMFVVGMELDLKVLRNKAHDAVVISHASIIVPFALGVGFAFFTYETFSPPAINFTSFALFMGIAMSITAFPVLARIVQERGLQKTKLGTIAITCAAADDITAWCILAAVIAIVKAGSFGSAIFSIIMAVGYVFAMLKIVKPFLKRIGDLHSSRENLTQSIVGIFFLTLILSAYVTEVIGIHALFGAFMTGVIIPDSSKFRSIFIDKVEDVAVVLLLPLFFVFTGLRTQIGLLNDVSLWATAGIIILIAVTGKFVGSALAAKMVGQNWKDSLSIGALMNTRGLVELVVLNIGYDLGVLTPEVFAMLVIMALVTTMMTGPALDLINKIFKDQPETTVTPNIAKAAQHKILISFGNPETGRSMFRLANFFTKNLNENSHITTMHLTPGSDLHSFNIDEYENESFHPIIEESHALTRKVSTLFKASTDLESDIAEVANKGDYDLLLVGVGKSIYQGTLLGKILGFSTRILHPEKLFEKVSEANPFVDSALDDRTTTILSKTKISTGVFIDKDFTKADRITVVMNGQQDAFLLDYAQRFISNNQSQILLVQKQDSTGSDNSVRERMRLIKQNAPNHLSDYIANELSVSHFEGVDLMITSYPTWTAMVRNQEKALVDAPSTLIIRNTRI